MFQPCRRLFLSLYCRLLITFQGIVGPEGVVPVKVRTAASRQHGQAVLTGSAACSLQPRVILLRDSLPQRVYFEEQYSARLHSRLLRAAVCQPDAAQAEDFQALAANKSLWQGYATPGRTGVVERSAFLGQFWPWFKGGVRVLKVILMTTCALRCARNRSRSMPALTLPVVRISLQPQSPLALDC